jgi:hypothetical protein
MKHQLALLSLSFCIASAPVQVSGQQAPRWQLAVERMIGEGERDELLLADVRGISVNARGDIFILDVRTQDIRMFNSRGEFVKRVARRGHGPGELANANGILALPDGSFAVNDTENSRIAIWNGEGVYQRQISITNSWTDWVWFRGLDDQGRIVEAVPTTTTARGANGRMTVVHGLRRVPMDGGQVDTIPAPNCASAGPPRTTFFTGARGAGPGMLVPFSARPVKVIDGSGGIWCSPGDEYRVDHLALGPGSLLGRITRTVAMEAIPQQQRDSAVKVVAGFARKWVGGNADPALVPTVQPVIDALMMDDRGRLWVRRPTLGAKVTRYDIWDNHKLIGIIESPIRLASFVPALVVGDRWYAVVVDDDGVQSIAVARIQRGEER